MSEPITITTADVARLLHHPEPESQAAKLKVGRLVRRGLPRVPHTRPVVFIRSQVIEWLAEQAARGGEDATKAAEPPPTRRRARRKRQAAPTELTPIQARLAEMRRAAS